MSAANVTCIGSGAGGDKSKGITLKEGTEAYAAGDLPRATERLETYLSHRPDGAESYSAHLFLGELYASQNRRADREQIISHFDQAAVPQAPVSVRMRALSQGGDQHFRWEDYAGAAERYTVLATLVTDERDVPDLYNRLGEALRRAGKWHSSVQIFRRLKDEFPQHRHAEKARRAVEWNRLGRMGFAVEFARHVDVQKALLFHEELRREGFETTVDLIQRDGEPSINAVRLKKLFPLWAGAVAEAERVRSHGYRVEIQPQ